MSWLISYEYVAVYRRGNEFSRTGPYQMICLIDEHPAKFVADSRKQLSRLQSRDFKPLALGDDRACDITHIFSAIKVPDDILTEDEVDCLS